MRKIILFCCLLTLLSNYAWAQQYYIIFFAYPKGYIIGRDTSLAGHTFVSFIKKDYVTGQSVLEGRWGFHHMFQSIKAFFKEEGVIHSERGTPSEMDFVVEIKDVKVYERCKQLKKIWDSKNYSVIAGETCVDFVRDVAYRLPGVLIPPSLGSMDVWQWPKDFLLAMKKLNYKLDVESRNSLSKVVPITDMNKKTLTSFSWHSDCTYKGVYDANTYTSTQLKNTALLCNFELNLILSCRVVMETPGNTSPYSKVDIHRLDIEYQRKSMWFKTAEFVQGTYWQQLKNRRLRELNQDYEALKIAMQYNSNPDILKNNRFSVICDKYVTALASKNPTTLLNAWRQLVNDQLKDNGQPEIIEKNFQEKYNSLYKIQWSKYELLVYGWQNCANTKIERVIDDGDIQEQFNKLFLRISKSECVD